MLGAAALQKVGRQHTPHSLCGESQVLVRQDKELGEHGAAPCFCHDNAGPTKDHCTLSHSASHAQHSCLALPRQVLVPS